MQQHRLLTAATLGAVLLVVPAPALAVTPPPPITCGSVITTSTHLTTDLTCTDQGITLRGDAMLDLRGHRLSGTSGTGITVVKADGSTAGVKNGSVEGWTTGLALKSVEGDEFSSVIKVSASRMTFRHNTSARINASTDSYYGSGWSVFVGDSSFAHNGVGVSGSFAAPVTVKSSRFVDNGGGIDIDTGYLNLSGSYLRNNGFAVGCTEAGCWLSRNELVHNGVAIFASYFGATLLHNVISDNDRGYGAFASGDSAVFGNVFERNKTAVDLDVSSGTLTSNRFLRNGTGVVTEDGQNGEPLVLKRNLFLINGNAMYLPDGGTSLQSNSAFNNTGWGLFAPGAIDLGGNKARGNKRLPQCVGVVC